MGRSDYILPDEEQEIANALVSGDADAAFALLSVYLSRNEIQLSDKTMRLYIEQEHFACISDRGHLLSRPIANGLN